MKTRAIRSKRRKTQKKRMRPRKMIDHPRGGGEWHQSRSSRRYGDVIPVRVLEDIDQLLSD